MRKKRIRVNYKIEKDLKEKIKDDKRWKNLSYFIREAIVNFRNNKIDEDKIHLLNEKINTLSLIVTTTLIFESDEILLNEIRKQDETYNYDLVYLLTLIIYNYSGEKLI